MDNVSNMKSVNVSVQYSHDLPTLDVRYSEEILVEVIELNNCDDDEQCGR